MHHQKEYMHPELLVVKLTLKDVILASPEDLSSHVTGGSEIDPIIDPDEQIEW